MTLFLAAGSSRPSAFTPMSRTDSSLRHPLLCSVQRVCLSPLPSLCFLSLFGRSTAAQEYSRLRLIACSVVCRKSMALFLIFSLHCWLLKHHTDYIIRRWWEKERSIRDTRCLWQGFCVPATPNGWAVDNKIHRKELKLSSKRIFQTRRVHRLAHRRQKNLAGQSHTQ